MNQFDSLSRRAIQSPESGIVAVANHGRLKPGLIPLWAGEGDEPTPDPEPCVCEPGEDCQCVEPVPPPAGYCQPPEGGACGDNYDEYTCGSGPDCEWQSYDGGDGVFFSAGKASDAYKLAGAARNEIAKQLD